MTSLSQVLVIYKKDHEAPVGVTGACLLPSRKYNLPGRQRSISPFWGGKVEFGPDHRHRQLERAGAAGGLPGLGVREPERLKSEGRGMGGG